MNRRKFLKSALIAGCGTTIANRLAAQTPREAQEKLILSAPLTHSDWMLKAGMKWGEPGVRHMLDACKACGWSSVYWRALDGGRSLYKSRLMRPQGKWDDDSYWSPKSEADRQLAQRFSPGVSAARREELLKQFAAMDYAHFDTLGAAVRYGHEIGLEIHAWVSINEDDHGWGLQSEFSKKHPEYRWRKRDGSSYHSQLSFAFPEVRKYKLAILKELLRNYPIDGFLLDWIRTGDVRDNPQTDTEGVANSGYEEPLVKSFKSEYDVDPGEISNGDDRWVRWRAKPQTEFMRAARKLTASYKKSIPVAVLVAHPWGYRGTLDKIDGNLRGLLLDVKTWAEEGLMDAAVAAGYYRDGGTPEMAYDSLKKETQGKVELWTYAWVPQNVDEFTADFDLARRLGAKQILFWEADYIDSRSGAGDLKQAMSERALWPRRAKS